MTEEPDPEAVAADDQMLDRIYDYATQDEFEQRLHAFARAEREATMPRQNPIHQPMGQDSIDRQRKTRQAHVQNIREIVDDLMAMGRRDECRIATKFVRMILDELDAVTSELMGAREGWNQAAAQLPSGRHARSAEGGVVAFLRGRHQALEVENRQLAQTNLELRQQIQDMDQSLGVRLTELLELRGERRQRVSSLDDLVALFGAPEPGLHGVDCADTLSVLDLAQRLAEPASDVQQFLDKTRWPIVCPEHGARIPRDQVAAVESTYTSWSSVKFLFDN